jgi:hypothetical protein
VISDRRKPTGDEALAYRVPRTLSVVEIQRWINREVARSAAAKIRSLTGTSCGATGKTPG